MEARSLVRPLRPRLSPAYLLVAALAATVSAAAIPPAQASRDPVRLLASVRSCRFSDDAGASVALQVGAMRCLVEHARSAEGLRALTPSAELRQAALMKVDADLRCQQFRHDPCGRPFFAVYAEAGYTTGSWALGENLAWGSGSRGSARAIMRTWLLSPDHRANLLSPEWREFGVALRTRVRFAGRSDVAVWAVGFGRHGL